MIRNRNEFVCDITGLTSVILALARVLLLRLSMRFNSLVSCDFPFFAFHLLSGEDVKNAMSNDEMIFHDVGKGFSRGDDSVRGQYGSSKI